MGFAQTLAARSTTAQRMPAGRGLPKSQKCAIKASEKTAVPNTIPTAVHKSTYMVPTEFSSGSGATVNAAPHSLHQAPELPRRSYPHRGQEANVERRVRSSPSSVSPVWRGDTEGPVVLPVTVRIHTRRQVFDSVDASASIRCPTCSSGSSNVHCAACSLHHRIVFRSNHGWCRN